MDRTRVALVRCDTYDDEQVYRAVQAGLELLGGISRFVKAGERIVMKPNVLVGTHPDRCVSTHPAVFKAVGRALQQAGVGVAYGDSSAFGKCEANMKKSRLKQAADELGLELADFESGRAVSHPHSLLIKSFVIASGVLDADGVVSLPKLKTHPLTRFTGAVKNQFGCVPGLLKSQYHVQLPDPYDFATMLVDINTLVRPRLCVMDGIMAMEGNGPRSGTPKRMNVLLLSADPVALDATACRIIGLDPEAVPTSRPGEQSGLGTYRSEHIEVVGESIEACLDRTFVVTRTPPSHPSHSRLKSWVKNRISQRPAIDRAKCTICGTCVRMCPVEPKAVDWHGGDKTQPPTYNYDRCIRCYCCQETCPEGAVYTASPLLGRLLFRVRG